MCIFHVCGKIKYCEVLIIIILSAGFGRLLIHELTIIKGQQKIIFESLNTLMGMKFDNASPSWSINDSEFSVLINMLSLSSDDYLRQVEERFQNQETAHKMVNI